MTAPDPLPDLAGRIRALDDQPLASHPDILEEVQQALVTELEQVGRLDDP